MKHTETKKIGKHTYTVYQDSPKRALNIVTKLTQYLGGPLGALIGQLDDSKKVSEQDLGKMDFGKSIQMLTQNLEEDELYEFFKLICSGTTVDMDGGKKGGGGLAGDRFDAHFEDRDGLSRMIKVVAFALEVNVGDFLREMAANAGLASQKG